MSQSYSQSQGQKQMYQVESIVAKRINSQTNRVQYQVKWVNYPPEENTWEPEHNLKFIKQMLAQFNLKNQLTGQKIQTNPKKERQRQQQSQSQKQKQSFRRNKKDFPLSDEEVQGGIFFEEQESEKQKNDQNSNSIRNAIKNDVEDHTVDKQSKDGVKSHTSSQNFSKVKSKIKDQILELKQKKLSQAQKSQSQQRKEIQAVIKNEDSGKLQRNTNQQSIRQQKIPPPLPPDFVLNKNKYIIPEQRKGQITQRLPMPNKHKMIQKKQIKQQPVRKPPFHYQYNQAASQIRPYNGGFGKPQESAKLNQIVYGRNGVQQGKMSRPPGQIRLPPPPPPSYYNHQPIVQQNYFSNQYQVYNPRISRQEYGQSTMTRPLPQQALHNPRIVSKTEQIYPPHLGNQNNFQSHPPYQYSYGHNPPVSRNNTQSTRNSMQIHEIHSIEKTDSGYIYDVSTSQGRKWLSRSQLVPKFSTQLVEFYERYLSFPQ